MSEKILDHLTLAGETAYIKEAACVNLFFNEAAKKAIVRAKHFNDGNKFIWTYAGLVVVSHDSRHFWASDLGFIAACRSWVRRYDLNGDWVRTWRIKSK